MLERTKERIKNIITYIDEKHFAYIITLVAFIVALIAVYTSNPYAEIISGKLVNIALYIGSCVCVTSLYGTLGLDVRNEIVKEHNIALALLFVGIYIGLALCVFS